MFKRNAEYHTDNLETNEKTRQFRLDYICRKKRHLDSSQNNCFSIFCI